MWLADLSLLTRDQTQAPAVKAPPGLQGIPEKVYLYRILSVSTSYPSW